MLYVVLFHVNNAFGSVTRVQFVTDSYEFAEFFVECQTRTIPEDTNLLRYEIICPDTESIEEVYAYLKQKFPETHIEFDSLVFNPLFKLALVNSQKYGIYWYTEVDDTYYFDVENLIYATYTLPEDGMQHVETVNNCLEPFLHLNLSKEEYRNILNSNYINWNNT